MIKETATWLRVGKFKVELIHHETQSPSGPYFSATIAIGGCGGTSDEALSDFKLRLVALKKAVDTYLREGK